MFPPLLACFSMFEMRGGAQVVIAGLPETLIEFALGLVNPPPVASQLRFSTCCMLCVSDHNRTNRWCIATADIFARKRVRGLCHLLCSRMIFIDSC